MRSDRERLPGGPRGQGSDGFRLQNYEEQSLASDLSASLATMRTSRPHRSQFPTSSGGARPGATLACALYRSEPAELILDEATNQLDLRSPEALEQMLQCRGALVIAAHDRISSHRAERPTPK